MASIVSKEFDPIKAKEHCPTCFISGNDTDVRRMMGAYGFRRVTEVHGADIVVFTGGADINPFLYGERCHRTTHPNFLRDLVDIGVFKKTQTYTQGLIGICRGAQLLNVIAGNGSMWQNVNHHAIEGTHDAIDTDGVVHKVNSYHHQMMIPGSEGRVLVKAHVSTLRESFDTTKVKDLAKTYTDEWDDPEAIYYPDRAVLCFQPHPEEQKAVDTRKLFFRLVEETMISDKMSKQMADYREQLAIANGTKRK